MVGYNLGDYIESKTRYSLLFRKGINNQRGGIILTFPTGEHKLPKSESDRLNGYLEMWYHLLTDT
jgi:hypothetical protein